MSIHFGFAVRNDRKRCFASSFYNFNKFILFKHRIHPKNVCTSALILKFVWKKKKKNLPCVFSLFWIFVFWTQTISFIHFCFVFTFTLKTFPFIEIVFFFFSELIFRCSRSPSKHFLNIDLDFCIPLVFCCYRSSNCKIVTRASQT